MRLAGEHYAAGRLDEDTYRSRLDALARATDASELRAAFADLPRPHPDTGRVRVSVHRGVLGVVGVCALVLGFQPPRSSGSAARSGGPSPRPWWSSSWPRDRRKAHRARRSRARANPAAGTDTQHAGLIRLSRADRERAVPDLAHHRDAGHLGLTDFEDRMSAVPRLASRADMELLFADLPEPHPDLSHVVAPAVAADQDFRSSVSASMGFAEAAGAAAFLVGVPASIVVWPRTGQWYWLPASLVASMVALGASDSPLSPRAGRPPRP